MALLIIKGGFILSLASYVKRVFVNNSAPAINATNLNAMDNEIYALDQAFPVSMSNGGLGGTTATTNAYNLINGLSAIVPVSADLFPFLDTSGGTSGRVTLTNLVAALQSAGSPQIASGTYVGTGTFGSSNKNSVVLGFVPKLGFITTSTPFNLTDVNGRFNTGTQIFVNGQTQLTIGTSPSYYTYPTWASTFQWYNTLSADCQMNTSGTTYNYVFVG